MLCKATLLVLALSCLAWRSNADTNVELPVGAHSVPVANVGEPQTGPSPLSGDPTVTGPDQTFTGDYAGGATTAGVADGKPSAGTSLDPAATEKVVADNSDVVKDAQPDLAKVNNAAAGKRRHLLGGRRTLRDLDLSGGGVSAGDSTAGVAANAYGHGIVGSNDVLDPETSHIEPHGVDATVTADGTATTTGAEANPDCVGEAEGFNEGPDCVGVEGK